MDVPRFYERTAPLAALSTQVRASSQTKDKATAAGRLARQLVRRGMEVRDALGLAEKSLTKNPDRDLALDVARWWESIGELGRSVAVAEAVVGELLPLQQREVLMGMAWSSIRLGKVDAAVQTLRRLMELAPDDPVPCELYGSLGFWSTSLRNDECALAYLRAAEIHQRLGDDNHAFESRLRAFELDPLCSEAAQALAHALRDSGRVGAADEIVRESLRAASAAQRAAYHERAFHVAYGLGKLEACFESALEAELDIDVDPRRVHALLLDDIAPGRDFETFLVKLVKEGVWGQTNMLASWLLALCESARSFDNTEQLDAISLHLVEKYGAEAMPGLDLSDNEDKVRALKTRLVLDRGLVLDRNLESQRELRFELVRRLCVSQSWEDALLAFGPVLDAGELSVGQATFGALIGGYASNLLTRVRSLVALASAFPTPAGAVTYAVAAEHLIYAGLAQEARQAADAAVEAEPKSERAIATQALVALRAPDGASATLLEHALSVLVARSDACALFVESASQRGSGRLAHSWAGRAFRLRPGDVRAARRFLQQACTQREPDILVETLREVLDQPAPLAYLESDVGDCLVLLTGVGAEQLERLGRKLVARYSSHHTRVFQKLSDLAYASGAFGLLATLAEVQLISVASGDRSDLYLALAEARLASGNFVAAARALRRGQQASLPEAKVKAVIEKFPEEVEEGDALLPLLEMRSDLVHEVSAAERRERLFTAGCARWDLAQDRDGAVQLWLRAAALDEEHGLDLFAFYLRTFAGSEEATEQLKEIAERAEDPIQSGRLLGLAAREMFRLGKRREAFHLGSAALEKAPSLADLLTIVEAACGSDTLSELEMLYQLLAERALGKFGERAAHYRAARQLEKRGAMEAALRHACAAFEAEPAEGVAYVMMVRLADATAGHVHLLAALGRAADRASQDLERGRWIGLAATLSDTESIGRRERLEILFRAAQMMPQSDTLERLFDGLAHCLADDPKTRDELWGRFVKLGRDVMASGSGEALASICLCFAVTALSHFEQADFALFCLKNAIRCDTTIEDYERLLPYVTQLSGLVGEAGELVEAVRATEGAKGALLGKGLARLAGKIAEVLGESEVRAELIVRAVSDFPEDAGLVAEARTLAQASGRTDLIARVEELLPARVRAQLVLERLAHLTDEAALDALVDLDAHSLPDADKARMLVEMGTRQQSIGRLDDAADTYQRVLEIDPDNDVALRGLEKHAEAHGDNEELLRILLRRIELSRDVGEVRRLTLRRAAVLETKLGRAPEARKLLQEFLERGEDRAALRLLSDSWERTGDFTEAAELWERVHAVALDTIEADDAAYRAARCHVQAGTPRRAQQSLEKIKKPTLPHLELALEVARNIGDEHLVFVAIHALCDVMVGDNARQGNLLAEAAELALGQKRIEDARRSADRALALVPNSIPLKLLVGRLRVQSGSPTTSADVEEMRALLSGTETLDNADDRAVACFLRAKSQMLSGDRQQARLLLENTIEEQGERPLLAALLAELLEASGETKRALELTDAALGGHCQGFYSAGELRLRAAELARSLGERELARGYLAAVTEDDALRARADTALEKLDAERTTPSETEERSATTNEEPPRSTLDTIRNAAREEHRRATLAVLAHEELAGRTDRRGSRPTLRAMIAVDVQPEDVQVSAATPLPHVEEALGSALHHQREAAQEQLASEAPRGLEVSVQEDVGVVTNALSATSDEDLLEKLGEGDAESGLALLDRLQMDKSRSRDAVIVAQHLVLLDPSDAQLLGQLVTAAYRDGNIALAAAARHILGAYGAGTFVAPPALDEVLDQNGAGLALLRQVLGPANEALGIVWEYAHSFFKKELSEYATGLERVPFNAPHLLGNLCLGVSKVTGLVKTPVFVAAGSDEISIQVALLQSPAVLVTGQIDELSPELVFHFGAMMAACAPEHALVFGAPEELVHNVLSALGMSFGVGRPDNRARPPAEVTRVASFLWEAVPARAQRRLALLCAEPEVLTYGALSGHSRLAVRRAGLIACGDLPTAIDDACIEFGLAAPRSLSELAETVRSCPSVLDLFQLALSSEYAQIRFQTSK